MIEEAVSLFRHQYGIHPAQSAYPVIDVYEKQHAYLYASSEEAVKAYKTQQNIIRWMMTYFLWPVAGGEEGSFGCRYDASFLRRSQISKT